MKRPSGCGARTMAWSKGCKFIATSVTRHCRAGDDRQRVQTVGLSARCQPAHDRVAGNGSLLSFRSCSKTGVRASGWPVGLRGRHGLSRASSQSGQTAAVAPFRAGRASTRRGPHHRRDALRASRAPPCPTPQLRPGGAGFVAAKTAPRLTDVARAHPAGDGREVVLLPGDHQCCRQAGAGGTGRAWHARRGGAASGAPAFGVCSRAEP